MVGIHPKIMSHRLNIDPQTKPVRQKRRTLDADRYRALQDEVDRFLKIGFIRESYYPDWLANPILVLKSNGKWRTCINFTNLNKACPKDNFPSLWIDQFVDATTRHDLLSFMNTYSGYNQIPIYEPDEEHISFITDCGLYNQIPICFLFHFILLVLILNIFSNLFCFSIVLDMGPQSVFLLSSCLNEIKPCFFTMQLIFLMNISINEAK